jgi:hypothetical protein
MTTPTKIIFRDNGMITDELSAPTAREAFEKIKRLTGWTVPGPSRQRMIDGEPMEIGDCETVEIS